MLYNILKQGGNKMKKLICVVFSVLIAIVFFTACDKNSCDCPNCKEYVSCEIVKFAEFGGVSSPDSEKGFAYTVKYTNTSGKKLTYREFVGYEKSIYVIGPSGVVTCGISAGSPGNTEKVEKDYSEGYTVNFYLSDLKTKNYESGYYSLFADGKLINTIYYIIE